MITDKQLNDVVAKLDEGENPRSFYVPPKAWNEMRLFRIILRLAKLAAPKNRE